MTTHLVDDRQTALKIGYTATDWHVPLAYDDYLRVADEWDVKTVIRDGKPIGAVYFKDGETHVSILPEWRRRWLTKSMLKELLAKTSQTRITPGHEYMYNILNRLGFVVLADGTLTREN